MSALHPYANFAFAFLIIVVHILYNDHIRTTIHQELKDVALGELWSFYIQIIALSAMILEGKLMFPPFPDDPLQWVFWFTTSEHSSHQKCWKWETVSFLSIYLMGVCFTWRAGLVQTSSLLSQIYLDLCPLRDRNIWLQWSTCCTISRDLMSWGSSTQSLGTAVQGPVLEISPTCCGDLSPQIGLDVWTVDCQLLVMLWCWMEHWQLFPKFVEV